VAARSQENRVEVDQKKIKILRGPGPVCQVEEVTWSSIRRVTAWKADCLTTDSVVIHLETGEGSYLFDDDYHGWERVIQDLAKHCPGAILLEAFWDGVVQPPFATNFTVLYEQSGEVPATSQ